MIGVVAVAIPFIMVGLLIIMWVGFCHSADKSYNKSYNESLRAWKKVRREMDDRQRKEDELALIASEKRRQEEELRKAERKEKQRRDSEERQRLLIQAHNRMTRFSPKFQKCSYKDCNGKNVVEARFCAICGRQQLVVA